MDWELTYPDKSSISSISVAFLPSDSDWMVSPSSLSTRRTLPHSCMVESLSSFRMVVTGILNRVERATAMDLRTPVSRFKADTEGILGGKRMHDGSTEGPLSVSSNEVYNHKLTCFMGERTFGNIIPQSRSASSSDKS